MSLRKQRKATTCPACGRKYGQHHKTGCLMCAATQRLRDNANTRRYMGSRLRVRQVGRLRSIGGGLTRKNGGAAKEVARYYGLQIVEAQSGGGRHLGVGN